MTTTDPNRLGPVTREWVAALERRIEQLEAPATVTSSATPPEIEWWDERELLLGDLQNARREIDRLRAQLADDRRDRAAARELGGRGYHNIEAVIVGRTHHEGMLRDECNAIVEELGRCKAQLAARPVVTATDEQVNQLRDALIATTSDMYATAIRRWLFTLNVVETTNGQ